MKMQKDINKIISGDDRKYNMSNYDKKFTEKMGPVITKINNLLSDGKTYNDIAEILNKDGYRTIRGYRFSYQSIYQLMHRDEFLKKIRHIYNYKIKNSDTERDVKKFNVNAELNKKKIDINQNHFNSVVNNTITYDKEPKSKEKQTPLFDTTNNSKPQTTHKNDPTLDTTTRDSFTFEKHLVGLKNSVPEEIAMLNKQYEIKQKEVSKLYKRINTLKRLKESLDEYMSE
jgi:hypothetical protein